MCFEQIIYHINSYQTLVYSVCFQSVVCVDYAPGEIRSLQELWEPLQELSYFDSFFTLYKQYLQDGVVFERSVERLALLHLKAKAYNTSSPQAAYRSCSSAVHVTNRAGVQPMGRRLSLHPQTVTYDQTAKCSLGLPFIWPMDFVYRGI